MEKANLFRRKRRFLWIIFGIGVFFFIPFGLIEIYLDAQDGLQLSFPGGDWGGILRVLLGILFGVSYLEIRKLRKFFLQYNDETISWYMPGMNERIDIPKKKVQKISNQMGSIEFSGPDLQEKLPLKSVSGKDRKDIERFVLQIN